MRARLYVAAVLLLGLAGSAGYLWLAGFDGNSTGACSCAIAFDDAPPGPQGQLALVVRSVSPGMRYGDLAPEGSGLRLVLLEPPPIRGAWGALRGERILGASDRIESGDAWLLGVPLDAEEIRLVDRASNTSIWRRYLRGE